MANKITVSVSLQIAGTQVSAKLAGSSTVNQVGSNYGEETQTITESAGVALDIPATITEGNLGYLVVKNLDAANPIDIATDDAMLHKIATVLAGQTVLIFPPGGTVALWGKATTADVASAFLAVEK